MAIVIGNEVTGNYGEDLFIAKAKDYLDNTYIIYRNRQLYGKEFDVCILMPDKGILVVELKGWREETIRQIDAPDTIVIATDEGEVTASPQKQARGYRFSMERHIRHSIGKFPLVFQMVCFPQVSRSFYKKLRMDTVVEEKFTILKEDLVDKRAFFAKLDEALREVEHWKRDPFDSRTMLEVRNLFEPYVEQKKAVQESQEERSPYHTYDYSRFYYFKADDVNFSSAIKEMIEQYAQGCKLYCVFSTRTQLQAAVDELDAFLAERGLTRNREGLEASFHSIVENKPKLNALSSSFMAFNCSFSLLNKGMDEELDSFFIPNGQIDKNQKRILMALAAHSQFNSEQYFVEHAAPEKNIVIRAGAGTGKTYTMISRIGYICYAQNVPLQQMAERIVMITFTNEAADQMEEKLKAYFRNCYLVTSRVEYLNMISHIDNMQISTIHSYAKSLIAKLGTSFGYGIDLGITSSEYARRQKITDILDAYIRQKVKECGKGYTEKLGMPVYAIRDSILDFIGKLHNKSVNIASIEASDFGSLGDDEEHRELHELLAYVIPAVEREYSKELLENNRIHLSSMMSMLKRFVEAPSSRDRILETKKNKDALQFMFVDEFQDTDDTQIETLLIISRLLNYRLFLVGDIKQCVYRFRGAKEKAFDQLKIQECPENWLEFSLQRNYRTDAHLLDIFDKSFSKWGAREDELLAYSAAVDKLIGTRDYNGYIKQSDKYYRGIPIAKEELRVPALIEEIDRLQKRMAYEEAHGQQLSAKEKSIAILVRENWQADLIRTECARVGITVQTSTGGDLYMSQPALDMLTLVNALVHFDEADYLYNLITSNFFNVDIPKSNLFEIRMRLRHQWRAKADEREQVNYLISFMNRMLVSSKDDYRWEHIVSSLRTKPVLQAVRDVYRLLEPWKNYSKDQWKQHYYQLNVDLLFEQLINTCNVDRLTINTLQEHLYNSIVSRVSVDSRTPPKDSEELPIQCITVHKSKGLEYGHVILPFCSSAIDYIKKTQLHISTQKNGERVNIGYSLNVGDGASPVQNSYYDDDVEKAEKSREETRILYVAMTRAIRSFSWIELQGKQNLSWQNLIETEV